MAQRDYVVRGQKKRQPAKKKKPLQTIAWFKVGLAILVVAFFVVALWYLKDAGSSRNESFEQEGQQASAINSDANGGANIESFDVLAPEDEKDPLPTLDEEEWEFIEGLPSYSVEVDNTELPSSGHRYLLQCASFKKESQAESLKAKIALQGFESQIFESKSSRGIWFRVVLGPYETKRDAESARNRLSSARINGCKMRNWD